MIGRGSDRLTDAQRALVDAWLPCAEVIADLSWNQVDTVVLRVRHDGRDLVVKAAGETSHHLPREIEAHEGGFVATWASTNHAARLHHADRGARVLVTDYLAGDLAYRTPAARDPAVHRRAGRLLRTFHGSATRPSEGTDAAATRRSLRWLDESDAFSPDVEARLRASIAALPPIEAAVVPTHGDWQPRNWLVDAGDVRVIDFGRFAFRPAATDFVRLAAQEWRATPECEDAFFDGYGSDPREPSQWLLMRLREAIGTAAWARQVGDTEFEAQGHRMVSDVLADIERR